MVKAFDKLNYDEIVENARAKIDYIKMDEKNNPPQWLKLGLNDGTKTIIGFWHVNNGFVPNGLQRGDYVILKAKVRKNTYGNLERPQFTIYTLKKDDGSVPVNNLVSPTANQTEQPKTPQLGVQSNRQSSDSNEKENTWIKIDEFPTFTQDNKLKTKFEIIQRRGNLTTNDNGYLEYNDGGVLITMRNGGSNVKMFFSSGSNGYSLSHLIALLQEIDRANKQKKIMDLAV